MARRRERGEAAVALPELRASAGVVGECAAGELAGTAGTVPGVRGVDWMAVSAGGAGGGGLVGVFVWQFLPSALDPMQPQFRSQLASQFALGNWSLYWLLICSRNARCRASLAPQLSHAARNRIGIGAFFLAGGDTKTLGRLLPAIPRAFPDTIDRVISILATAGLVLLIRWAYWSFEGARALGSAMRS